MKGSARIVQVLLSLAVGAAALIGGWQSVRMTKAYVFAAAAKDAKDRNRPADVVRYCEASHTLYPNDHYVCILAADFCQRLAKASSEPSAPGWYTAAERWCARGLALNPYRSEIRVLKTQLLLRGPGNVAASYWREYLDWNWWVPYNHAVMIGLYIHAGDPDAAREHLVWVRGSEYATECRRLVHDALMVDLTPPSKRSSRAIPKPAGLPKQPPAP